MLSTRAAARSAKGGAGAAARAAPQRIRLKFDAACALGRLRARDLDVPSGCTTVRDLADIVAQRSRLDGAAAIRLRDETGLELAPDMLLSSVFPKRAAHVPIIEAWIGAAPQSVAVAPSLRSASKRRRDEESLDSVHSPPVKDPPPTATTRTARPTRRRTAPRDSDVAEESSRRLNVLRGDAASPPPASPPPPPRCVSRAAQHRDSANEEGYPMSDYDADEDEEPLHLKPLVPDHKRRLVPKWAVRDDELLVLAKAQADVDASIIFGLVPTTGLVCNLREVFGYSPVKHETKRRRRDSHASEQEARHSSASEEAPQVDIEIRCVASSAIPKKGSSTSIPLGFEYVAVMTDSDTFGNLRRHYAKHNLCVEARIELHHRVEGQPDRLLDLSLHPRALGLSGTAVIAIKNSTSYLTP
ncbi:hypothetical protein M885DRAFT_552765 [Pelagophyceae sp. CCMP2097]|nr:hypothetical protein M885DRAFT_552765 [Pelagophyceae sp. CCMP2097]